VTSPVKPLTRRERATATRARITDAAAACFGERGYAGTTMDIVAAKAGVAIQTVYFVFHSKPKLLIETISANAWATDQRPQASESFGSAIVEAADGPRRLAIAVDAGVEIYRRAASLFPVLAEASSIDPDVLIAWQRIVNERRAGMTRIAELMSVRGELRRGLSAEHAADILVGLHRHELYLAFTRDCGWSIDAFKAWLYSILCRELLPSAVATAALTPGSKATADRSFAAELVDLP
jgi:TetR/AcrR family transcriptional regulator of autoinduction and epiphytic fitness